MQVAIVSDIHGNRHAFEAVLADVQAGPAEAIWCLGDLVGYGADPDACCRLARRARRRLPRRQPRPRRDGRPRPRRVLARRRARRALDAGGHRRGPPRIPGLAEPARRRERGVGLYHAQPARSRLGVRALRPAGRAVPRRAARARCRSSATRTSRSPSCAPRASRRPARRGAAARSSTSPTASGSSTRAASASRATATRAPPGCCSTPSAWIARWRRDRVRHRGRRGRDPRRAPARLAGRAPGVRSVRMRVLPLARSRCPGRLDRASSSPAAATAGSPRATPSSLTSALNQIAADYRAGRLLGGRSAP